MTTPTDALRLGWDDVYRQSLQLAELIEDHRTVTGEKFDLMVVVPRGGLYPANIVSRVLGFEATDILQAAIGSYRGNAQGDFKLGQMPTAKQVRGKNLLVIDEVCDTGQTLSYLTGYLKEAGAKLIRTGVLHYKPDQSQTDFRPDWAVETTDQWVVYPWEIHDRA